MLRLALVLVAMTAMGCGSGPSEDECKKLVAHLIDLELAKQEASGDAEARAKVEAEANAPNLKFCMENLPTSQVECGLKAKTMEEVQACDK